MNEVQKKEIQDLLNIYVSKFTSQSKAVNSLNNVSEATIIAMRSGNPTNGKWDSISDDMWRKVGKQVGLSAKGTWRMVHTQDFNMLKTIFDDAKEFSNVFAVVAPSGSGKTAISNWYVENNKNVYHVVCAEYYNRKVFLSKLLDNMGKDSSGSVSEMMDTIKDTLIKQENPILILDEADKLNDTVLYFFITLYNELQGKCGIVLLATDYLSKRVAKGRRLNRKGYSEIYSRIGRRFISLRGTTQEEISKICEANGLNDPAAIMGIYNECEGDLRRVERGVHKANQSNRKKSA
jgi:DNA transposition AAA+ family ATPase